MSKKPKTNGEPVLGAAMWPIAKIIPYDKNPRTHPPAQLALLAEMIKRFGWDQPIVVDERGVILKGHGRRAAAVLNGMAEAPVVKRTGLSDEEKREMRISDNQISLLSGWDNELLRSELVELKALDYDLSRLGFGDAQLVSFMTIPKAPDEFAAFGEDIPTEHQCPKCGYRWSGGSGAKDE